MGACIVGGMCGKGGAFVVVGVCVRGVHGGMHGGHA